MTYKLSYSERKAIREWTRKYRDTNRDKITEYNRLYMRSYWKNNPDKYQEHLQRMRDYMRAKRNAQ